MFTRNGLTQLNTAQFKWTLLAAKRRNLTQLREKGKFFNHTVVRIVVAFPSTR